MAHTLARLASSAPRARQVATSHPAPRRHAPARLARAGAAYGLGLEYDRQHARPRTRATANNRFLLPAHDHDDRGGGLSTVAPLRYIGSRNTGEWLRGFMEGARSGSSAQLFIEEGVGEGNEEFASEGREKDSEVRMGGRTERRVLKEVGEEQSALGSCG